MQTYNFLNLFFKLYALLALLMLPVLCLEATWNMLLCLCGIAGIGAFFTARYARYYLGIFDLLLSEKDTSLDEVQVLKIQRSAFYGSLFKRFRDIQSALKSEVKRVRNERGQLDAVLSIISDGVIVLDASRRVMFANLAAKKLCEITKPDIEGKFVEEVIPIPLIQEWSRSQDLFEREFSQTASVFQNHQEKQYFVQSKPFRGDEEKRVVMMVRDLSEFFLQEKKRSEFIANASHDLKTPLTVIKGYLDIVDDDDLAEDKKRKFFKKISENVDHLVKLTQNLFELSKRREADDGKNHLTRVNLAKEVRRWAEGYRNLAANKGLGFEVTIEEGAFVMGETTQLKTIVDNLLDNALKYTAQGCIRVSIKCVDPHAVLQVSDTGLGIAEEEQKRIFDRFYRADVARKSEGFGLGLAMVKQAVLDLGGTIEIESKIHQGSTFTVLFPLLGSEDF